MKSKKVKRVINKEWEKAEPWFSKKIAAREKRKEELVKYFIDKFRSLFPGENPKDVICLLQDGLSELIPIDKSKIKYVPITEEGMDKKREDMIERRNKRREDIIKNKKINKKTISNEENIGKMVFELFCDLRRNLIFNIVENQLKEVYKKEYLRMKSTEYENFIWEHARAIVTDVFRDLFNFDENNSDNKQKIFDFSVNSNAFEEFILSHEEDISTKMENKLKEVYLANTSYKEWSVCEHSILRQTLYIIDDIFDEYKKFVDDHGVT